MSTPMPASVLPRSQPPSTGALPVTRVPSIDAFRGLVMFLMLAEAMRLWTLHDAFPSSLLWSIVAFNTQHVPWQGCSLHDLIQPAFSFLAGASLPFSIASRQAKGESFRKMLGHTVRRSLTLILLGIFLRSMGSHQTYWTFEDTLTQIGLGYTLLFLLAFASRRVQVGVFLAILVGFWAAFALYPLPPATFDYAAVGVPAGWPHLYTGFLAHFNMNSNLSWAFDTWFLNLFPRESPFQFNEGGWSTLSFIPTLATMMLGTWAGAWLKGPRTMGQKLKGLVGSGHRPHPRRPPPPVASHLPDRETRLDVFLHALQRRPHPAHPRRVLRGDRDPGVETLVVPAHGDRRQLHRHLRDELDDGALRGGEPSDPPRRHAAPPAWPALRAGAPGHRRPARLLVDPLLDVPQEDLHQDLIYRGPGPPRPFFSSASFLSCSNRCRARSAFSSSPLRR